MYFCLRFFRKFLVFHSDHVSSPFINIISIQHFYWRPVTWHILTMHETFLRNKSYNIILPLKTCLQTTFSNKENHIIGTELCAFYYKQEPSILDQHGMIFRCMLLRKWKRNHINLQVFKNHSRKCNTFQQRTRCPPIIKCRKFHLS